MDEERVGLQPGTISELWIFSLVRDIRGTPNNDLSPARCITASDLISCLQSPEFLTHMLKEGESGRKEKYSVGRPICRLD
ncbi:hypothetical protein KIN20_020510 [Parelaphostrongylus tenuis]|uniref:Uncharacterized protein n=1 Tax=Parelaphostrongylus tenuis TaxID=148309 RepID=A0AAD5QJ03_PARTN|nr:hypothetical protein KIN20_010717 [Parelaphostrongylus tenuis]KAJ1361294.1 hypothetical protein KIN20_020510 [Parelaphostrongylus tenuis]